MNNYENCMECNEPLLKRTKIRETPRMCADCRGSKSSGNSQVRKIFLEMQKRSIIPDEEEMTFADKKFSKWAEKQDAMEVGRIIIQSTPNASYGVSPLYDMMKAYDPNQHRKKNSLKKEGAN